MQRNFSALTKSGLANLLQFLAKAGLFLQLSLFISCPANAFERISEANISHDVRQSLTMGQAIELPAEKSQFLAIYQQTSHPVKLGGAIIVHGLGQNPDFPEIIRPLRTGLAASGWDTLSIQMPIPAIRNADNHYPDTLQSATARITAAVKHFADKNIQNVSLVGFGLGAQMAATYLQQSDNQAVRGFCMISMDASTAPLPEYLEKIATPVLDVYASRDLPEVISSAYNRKLALSKNSRINDFRQVVLEGADHAYTGLDESLVNLVKGWLGRYAAGNEITTD